MTTVSEQDIRGDISIIQDVEIADRRRIAAVVAAGVLVGVAGASTAAYVVQRGAAEDLARGRVADSARLQGQADAYLPEQAIGQGRAADAERLLAQAEWWLRTHRDN